MCAGRRWRGKLSVWGESETQGKKRENTTAGLDGFSQIGCICQVKVGMVKGHSSSGGSEDLLTC